MRIKYYKDDKLICSTNDYVPKVGEIIRIDNIDYEVCDKNINIVALHTEIEVYLMEKIYG